VLRADSRRLALLAEEASLMAALEHAGGGGDGEDEDEDECGDAAGALEGLSLSEDASGPRGRSNKGSKRSDKSGAKRATGGTGLPGAGGGAPLTAAWWSETVARLTEVSGRLLVGTTGKRNNTVHHFWFVISMGEAAPCLFLACVLCFRVRRRALLCAMMTSLKR
jgi:hypothetical protein